MSLINNFFHGGGVDADISVGGAGAASSSPLRTEASSRCSQVGSGGVSGGGASGGGGGGGGVAAGGTTAAALSAAIVEEKELVKDAAEIIKGE